MTEIIRLPMSKCPALILLFFSMVSAYGQSGKGSNEELALNHARELYHSSLSEQSGIYSGPDYIGYPHATKDGHQFFFSTDAFKGDVYYDGIQYKNIPLWYDIARNEVVAQHFDGYSRISLHPEKVRDFSIFNHNFIKIDQKASAATGLSEGFYDQLYARESEILVRRSKDFVITTNLEGIWVSFSGEKTTIFLRTGSEYSTVSSQKSVLNALGKYEREVLAHLKQSGIKFRKEREKAITIMVAHFDELNK